MGKCKFFDKWLEDPEFKDWLRPVEGKDRQTFYSAYTTANECHRPNQLYGYSIEYGRPPGDDGRHTNAAHGGSLVDAINKAGPFVLMFDESLNQSSKKKQLDIHVRYWEDGCVQSRYFGSQFLGHGRADDLLHHIKECVAQLNMMQVLSVSMDGPNSLLRWFVQRELLQDLTPLQLTKIEVSDDKNFVSPRSVDIGLGAESAIKALQSKPGSKVGELSVLTFRRECMQCLVKVVRKLQEKSPLKFPVMKSIGQTFIQGKQLAGGISAATVERGFSVNKEVETCHLLDESLEALRLICDKVSGCGGILKVPLTEELLAYARS
ncbi:unnamed protein product [Leuciscus chuanchicus]